MGKMKSIDTLISMYTEKHDIASRDAAEAKTPDLEMFYRGQQEVFTLVIEDLKDLIK